MKMNKRNWDAQDWKAQDQEARNWQWPGDDADEQFVFPGALPAWREEKRRLQEEALAEAEAWDKGDPEMNAGEDLVEDPEEGLAADPEGDREADEADPEEDAKENPEEDLEAENPSAKAGGRAGRKVKPASDRKKKGVW